MMIQQSGNRKQRSVTRPVQQYISNTDGKIVELIQQFEALTVK